MQKIRSNQLKFNDLKLLGERKINLYEQVKWIKSIKIKKKQKERKTKNKTNFN